MVTRGQGGGEEYEHFIEVRRHVKRMQAGTPLLLRTGPGAGTGGGGSAVQEDLRICTFWVTQDLQMLQWREQEGDGPSSETCEVPLGAIAEVVEDTSRQEEEDHHALTLVLRPGASKQVPNVMGLICASPEDLETWHNGLKFLVGSLPPPQSPTRSGAPSFPMSPVAEKPLEPEAEQNLRETLREQLEMNEKLRKENDLLREVVKRKDATIAMMMRDMQRGSIVGDSSGKTESTSRESDEHLSYREAAILRRKNKRLQKAVRAKQQTVSDLLSIIGRGNAQQGAESSAVEDADEDEELSDGTQTTEDRRIGSGRRAVGRSGSLADVGATSDSAGGGPPEPIGRPGSRLRRGSGPSGSSETDDVREEMMALAGKRDRLAQSATGRSFEPPPRKGPAAPAPAPRAAAVARQEDSCTPASPGLSAPAAALFAAAAAAATAPSRQEPPAAVGSRQAAGGPAGGAAEQLLQMAASMGLAGAGARGATAPAASTGATRAAAPAPAAAAPAPAAAATAAAAAAAASTSAAGMGSAAALEVLAREMQKLEEKKRTVEQLAKRLEPASDAEEDDGFPLR